MMVLSRAEGTDEFLIHALKNNFEADAYFVKVIGEFVTCGRVLMRFDVYESVDIAFETVCVGGEGCLSRGRWGGVFRGETRCVFVCVCLMCVCSLVTFFV